MSLKQLFLPFSFAMFCLIFLFALFSTSALALEEEIPVDVVVVPEDSEILFFPENSGTIIIPTPAPSTSLWDDYIPAQEDFSEDSPTVPGSSFLKSEPDAALDITIGESTVPEKIFVEVSAIRKTIDIFAYGFTPLLIAVLLLYFGYRWFYNTFIGSVF